VLDGVCVGVDAGLACVVCLMASASALVLVLRALLCLMVFASTFTCVVVLDGIRVGARAGLACVIALPQRGENHISY
jgi:hypothetical protein